MDSRYANIGRLPASYASSMRKQETSLVEAVCGRCGAIFDVTKIIRRPDGSMQWTQAPSSKHGMHFMVQQICPVRYNAPEGSRPICPDEEEAVRRLADRYAPSA
ncbi:hypothetical protein EAH89_19510 [Roseomonas nepalensis]|uniref:Uncharacterized protein n=1 Tax=Muricoccus nepalensis TaxID=1854500 RepID=A0A502FQV0_9PROT|nr:hypothetical protein EAH89_19510 [Roseomonas nepalensis]